MKKVIISVTNDLSTDQRVHKVANSLLKFGYEPVLVGVKRANSQAISQRKYATKRLRLIFHKGFFFYANYNICLFLYLLFSKANVLVANDLDSLPANYFAYKLKNLTSKKRLKIVYDSHELFTEVPELYNRKLVKKIWLKFEQFILPKIEISYTVCQSIADYYHKKYKVNMYVVKNMPLCQTSIVANSPIKLQIAENKNIILYQGALNIGRCIENIIKIMDRLDNTVFLVVGKGDIEHNLHKMVIERQLQDKVIFTGAVKLEQLSTLTRQADIGLVLQEDLGLSYHYALPNRLFDFIRAGVPILASNQPEISNIVVNENIGLIVDDLSESCLLLAINELLTNKEQTDIFKQNMQKCAYNYCWEKQENLLKEIYALLN